MLHKLTILFISVWTLHSLLITPFYFYYQKDTFQMILKGMFCNRINITNERNENFQKLSLNPKVQAIFGTLCYLGFSSFFYFACKRSLLYHNIPKKQINLISAKTQYFLNIIILTVIFVDDIIMNPLLEIFYNQIGPEMVFNIWVSYRMIGTLGKKFNFNIFWYRNRRPKLFTILTLRGGF